MSNGSNIKESELLEKGFTEEDIKGMMEVETLSNKILDQIQDAIGDKESVAYKQPERVIICSLLDVIKTLSAVDENIGKAISEILQEDKKVFMH